MSERKRSEKSCKPNGSIGNTFVNDGSFLEMFRKRMDEEKAKVVSQPAPTVKEESRTRTSELNEESKELKPDNSEGTSDQSESGSNNASGDKPIIQVLIGLCFIILCHLVMLWNKDFSSPVCSL